MKLLLHNVFYDITRVSGMPIIKAILAGGRKPKALAVFWRQSLQAQR
jgi:hypothetical protein